MKKYDVIIIGGGAAALTAAIYTARKKLSTLIIAKEVGGQTAWAADIENYPGYEKIKGVELIMKMRTQVDNLKVEIKESETVKRITGNYRDFIIITNENEYNSKSIIICTGKEPRKLDIPGEKEFLGRGVAYCAICDAPLFCNKTVTVIGSGNSALDSTVELSKYAKKVYLLTRAVCCSGDLQTLEEIKKISKVEIIEYTQAKEIKGDKFVNKLIYTDTESNKEKTLKTEGVFIEIGYITSAGFTPKGLKKNSQGEIIIDHKTGATNISGIFAAGDVTDCTYKQTVISCGAGAVAALSVYEYLKKKN